MRLVECIHIFLIICAFTLSIGINKSVSATVKTDAPYHELQLMRLIVKDQVVYGIGKESHNNAALNQEAKDIEVKVIPGESFQIKVELVDELGNIIDVTRDPKTVYESRRLIATVSETGLVTITSLNEELQHMIEKGYTLIGHLAVYYNLIDKNRIKNKNPTGNVAAALVWLVISPE